MIKSLAEIGKFQREAWGLKGIPFPDVPPSDPARVASFYIGRDEEYIRARNSLYQGDNVLLRGTWGIGKTAFILSTLYRLQNEISEQEGVVRSAYIKDFRGGDVAQFYSVVNCGLKRAMRGASWSWLRWILPQEFGINVWVIEAKWQPEQPTPAVLQELESLLERAKRKGYRLIVAIDDLDKTALRQGSIATMLKDALHILRDERCAFLLTGRAITRMDDLEISHLGIINEIIPLKPLSDDELCQAAVKQLNTVRIKQQLDTFPFNEEVISSIAKKSIGIPRVFYRLCKKTLDKAAEHGYRDIDNSAFQICYQAFQDDLSIQIPPDVKRILYYTLRRNGFLISSKEETLEEALSIVGASTVYDLVPYLDKLVRADYMVRVERPEGISYEIAPGTERAAEEGKKVNG